MNDINEFNNNYSGVVLPGVFSNIVTNVSGINTINTTNFDNIAEENSNYFRILHENTISEVLQERNNSINTIHPNDNIYSKIFESIKNKLFIINDDENGEFSNIRGILGTPGSPCIHNTQLKEKYKYDETMSFINNLKQKIVELHNKKIETEIIFSNNKEKYTKFTDNILIFTKTLKNFENNDEQLIELLTDKIEWYYSTLNLEYLAKECSDLVSEQSFIKNLLSELAGMVPAVVCQICLDKQVNYFIDSCGHTLCVDCMEKSKEIKKCHFCRKHIISFKKLYL